MKKVVLILAAALALNGCAVAGAVGALSSITNTSNSVTLTGTKTLTIAADAYTGVATLVSAAVNKGAFSPAQLQTIGKLNDEALALLQGSNKTLTEAQRAAGLLKIVDQFNGLLGSK